MTHGGDETARTPRRKIITLKPGTTIVCQRSSDGKNIELVVYSEREAADQHLDVHDREAAIDEARGGAA